VRGEPPIREHILDELAEHKNGVAGVDNDVEQLLERREFPRPTREWASLMEYCAGWCVS